MCFQRDEAIVTPSGHPNSKHLASQHPQITTVFVTKPIRKPLPWQYVRSHYREYAVISKRCFWHDSDTNSKDSANFCTKYVQICSSSLNSHFVSPLGAWRSLERSKTHYIYIYIWVRPVPTATISSSLSSCRNVTNIYNNICGDNDISSTPT